MMMGDFYSLPPDYERQRKMVYDLKGKHKILRAFSIGKSALGRGIFALAIGDVKGASLFVGGVHALEWLTTSLLFRFCEDVLKSVENGVSLQGINIKKGLENTGVVIIPCLNPDGVDIALYGESGALSLSQFVKKVSGGDFSTWQANAHGVDLNHNFDAGWNTLSKMEKESGILGAAPTRYGGPRPFSEPESRALANVTISMNIRQVFAFHSQGEEIYYKYGKHTPAKSQLMAEILASCCGYTVAVPKGLASHGGYKDWFIEKLCRPGFTIEIGRGKNPLPIEDLEPIYARLLEMLILAMLI